MTPLQLKFLREKAGVTQKQLARKIEVSQSLVASMEVGRRRIRGVTARAIKQVLSGKQANNVT